MDAALWDELTRQLSHRGAGRRESGAFLLAARPSTGSTSALPEQREPARVIDVAYYDDLDAHCLTGGIDFSADGYTALAGVLQARQLRVVADIHTHPGSSVQQSCTDASHPMSALPGHVALIAPRYGAGTIHPRDLGVHTHLGQHTWDSAYGPAADHAVKLLSSTPTPRRLPRALRAVASRLTRRPR